MYVFLPTPSYLCSRHWNLLVVWKTVILVNFSMPSSIVFGLYYNCFFVPRNVTGWRIKEQNAFGILPALISYGFPKSTLGHGKSHKSCPVYGHSWSLLRYTMPYEFSLSLFVLD